MTNLTRCLFCHQPVDPEHHVTGLAGDRLPLWVAHEECFNQRPERALVLVAESNADLN